MYRRVREGVKKLKKRKLDFERSLLVGVGVGVGMPMSVFGWYWQLRLCCVRNRVGRKSLFVASVGAVDLAFLFVFFSVFAFVFVYVHKLTPPYHKTWVHKFPKE